MSGGQDVLAEQLNGGFDEMEYREMTPGLPVEDGLYLCKCEDGEDRLLRRSGDKLMWTHSGCFVDRSHVHFIISHWRIPPEKPAPLAVGLYRVNGYQKDWIVAIYPNGDVYRSDCALIGSQFQLNPGWTITEVLAKAEPTT